MADICVPKLGMSASEVTLAEWMCKDGDNVQKGDVICAVEGDKSLFDIEAQESGIIRTVAKEGEMYNIGDVIASIE